MAVGTPPTKQGISPSLANLDMFTYKIREHDAVSMCHYRHVCVCGQRVPSALVTPARYESRGWDR